MTILQEVIRVQAAVPVPVPGLLKVRFQREAAHQVLLQDQITAQVQALQATIHLVQVVQVHQVVIRLVLVQVQAHPVVLMVEAVAAVADIHPQVEVVAAADKNNLIVGFVLQIRTF